MRNKRVFLIISCVFMVLISSIASVSAQEIDVESMDNAQLTNLLLQILNNLQQEDDTEAETQAVPVPAADPEVIEEVIHITIYENKKLTVEALPGYMFIQPTKEPGPKPGPDNMNTDTREDLESYCTGICMGFSDFYGTDMLDMGCYAKCVGDI